MYISNSLHYLYCATTNVICVCMCVCVYVYVCVFVCVCVCVDIYIVIMYIINSSHYLTTNVTSILDETLIRHILINHVTLAGTATRQMPNRRLSLLHVL